MLDITRVYGKLYQNDISSGTGQKPLGVRLRGVSVPDVPLVMNIKPKIYNYGPRSITVIS